MLCQTGGKTGRGPRKGSRVGRLCQLHRELTWQAQDLDIGGLPARHLVGCPVHARSRMQCVGLFVGEIKASLRVTAHFLAALLYHTTPDCRRVAILGAWGP